MDIVNLETIVDQSITLKFANPDSVTEIYVKEDIPSLVITSREMDIVSLENTVSTVIKKMKTKKNFVKWKMK